MKFWIIGVLSVFSIIVFGQETSCPTLSIRTAPAIKAYRLDGGKCTTIRNSVVELGQGVKRLVFHSISNCRDFPALPNSCEIPVSDIWKADSNGDCEVGVEWAVLQGRGATCSTVDR